MVSLSYWIVVSDQQDNVVWEGMVYAREENEQLRVDTNEADPTFFQVMQSRPGLKIAWEPVWKDITNERRLPSEITGSENANISTV